MNPPGQENQTITPPATIVTTCMDCGGFQLAPGGDWQAGPPPAGARLSHGLCPADGARRLAEFRAASQKKEAA